MGGNKLIIFLFFMFGMVLTSKGQTVPYTYIDPCTGVSTTVQVPTTSGTVTMFYGGQYQTFTYAQLQAGAYDQWVASINAQFPPGTDPCAGLGGDVTDDFNTIMGSTTAGNVANITGIVQMAAGLANSTSGAANTAGGISSSLGGGSTSSGDGGGSSSSNNDGGDEGSSDSGGNSSSSNSGTSSSSSGNSSTGSSSSSGGNTSTGGDSGSGTSTGGSTGSGTSTGSGNSNGGSTSTGSGSSSGGDTGSSGSSGTSTGGDTGGGNTGGGSTGGGNTGGSSSGGGGSTGSSSGSGEPSVGTGDGSGISADNGGGNTSSDSDMGGMGDQTTTTASGGESESGSDGGSGGGGGRKKSKQEKVGRGALIGAGDFVVIRNSANPRDTGVDNFKFNASLTHLNTKRTFIKGANFNYQTGENIGNLTLYGSFKTERNMFIFSNATMSNFSSDIFNTTSVMDAVKINKITIMGGTNYTYGYLGKGQFSNWSIIGGGFTNFQGGRYLSSNVMLLGVYSPYIFYYEGQWYKSGLLFIPLINNDIKITDTFKWSISFAGVYQYKGDVLNWQLSTGTKILL